MNFIILYASIALLLNIIIIGWSLRFKQNSCFKRHFISSLSFHALWISANIAMIITHNNLLLRLVHALALWALATGCMWVWVLQKKPTKPSVLLKSSLYGISTILTAFSFFPGVLFNGKYSDDISFEHIYAPLFDLYTGFILVLFGLISGRLIYLYKTSSHTEKKQLIYISFGLLIYLSIGITGLIFSANGYPELGYLDSPSSIFFLGIAAYAISKQYLMDVNVVISSGIAKILTLLIFSASFGTLYEIYTTIFSHKNINTSILLLVGAIALLSVCELYPKINKAIQTIPDTLLVKPRYNYADVAPTLIAHLEKCIYAKDVLSALHDTIDNKMGLHLLNVYILKDMETSTDVLSDYQSWDFSKEIAQECDNADNELHNMLISEIQLTQSTLFCESLNPDTVTLLTKHNIGACIPFIAKGNLLGFAFIEKLPDNLPYTYDDQRLFEMLTPQIGIALDRIRAYAKVTAGFEKVQKTASLLSLMNQYTHDIKAPLDILEIKYGAEDGAKQQLDRVRQLVTTMLKVANDQRTFDPKPISLNDVVSTTLDFYPISGGAMGFVDLNDIPTIYGDKEDLQILITNLIKNAKEAMIGNAKPEGNRIWVTTELSDDQQHVVLTIKDNGPGIPKDIQEKIWNAFESHSKKGGSGIGLSAVTRIVAEHGASITMDSITGEGTTFTIQFPVDDAASSGSS